LNDIELKDFTLPSISNEQMVKIENQLQEYRRAKSIIGHSHSQTQYALLTLTMLDDSPMSRMKQALANVQKKWGAVQSTYFSLEKQRIELRHIDGTDELSLLRKKEIETTIDDTQIHMQNSLREIGMLMNYYEEIRIKNKIPKNWSEADYENQEIANMLRMAFRLGIQHIMVTSRLSKSAVEYFEQLGIHPSVAEKEVRDYLVEIDQLIIKDKKVTVEKMYEFLDYCAVKYKDEYRHVLNRIGLTDKEAREFQL